MLKQALQIIKKASTPNNIIPRDTVTFRKLMDILGNPYKDFKAIHITGTNGKGSVALKTATVLQKAGYKTGLYTSPHLFSFLERIQINRTKIEQNYFAEKILMLHEIRKRQGFQITFFEVKTDNIKYLTAASFLYFKDQKCDFASIEVGLGGQYDTTNVIDPELSIITSIGLDHQRLLGNTRQQIAFDKAGIIKPNKPVIVGPNAMLSPIIQRAKQKKSPLITLNQSQFQDFEEQNNSIVKQAIKELQDKGFQISQQAQIEGLKARQPCRMQFLPNSLKPKEAQKKNIILDVGHNPQAIRKMIEYYRKNVKKDGQKLAVIFGSSKEKKFDESLQIIEEQAQRIYVVQANHYRANPIANITQYIGNRTKNPSLYRMANQGNIQKTISWVLQDQQADNILICGSFFMMPEVMGYFDKSYLNLDHNISEAYDMKPPM